MTKNIASYFRSGTRDSGEKFYTLVDDHPEWLQDAVREAHLGDLPNDWIYAECRAAVEAFDANELDSDTVHEYADGRVDIYTRALYQWAADFCLTDMWSSAESEAADLGSNETEPEKWIAMIQYCAIRSIAETMRAACEKSEESEESEESGA